MSSSNKNGPTTFLYQSLQVTEQSKRHLALVFYWQPCSALFITLLRKSMWIKLQETKPISFSFSRDPPLPLLFSFHFLGVQLKSSVSLDHLLMRFASHCLPPFASSFRNCITWQPFWLENSWSLIFERKNFMLYLIYSLWPIGQLESKSERFSKQKRWESSVCCMNDL